MPAKPPSVPSALARREAARILLAGAVDCRDAKAVLTFTGHWVHRQGIGSLGSLMAELAEGDSLRWWQTLLEQPIEGGAWAPVPTPLVPAVQPRQQPPADLAGEGHPPELQAPESGELQAPKPNAPTPDPQSGEAPASAESTSVPGAQAAGSADRQPVDMQSVRTVVPKEDGIQGERAPVEPGECQTSGANPEGPSKTPSGAAGPSPAQAPPPLAQAVVDASGLLPRASRPAGAQGRRGASTSRPAPAPRNPELARLRAWLPDSDVPGGASSRSHAA